MKCHPVVQDGLQKGVFAELVGELHRDRPTAYHLAHLAGVGMATPPGVDVTDDHELGPPRASRPLAARHRHQGIGGVGLEALTLPAGLLDGPSCPLCCQLEAVDERHSALWWERTCETDHAEAVAPVAEVPCPQLLAMEVINVGFGLAVLAGFVTQLSKV